MENVTGNISTIAKLIVMIIAPYMAVYGITASQLESILIAIITLIIAIIDARYPNTLSVFDNETEGESDDTCTEWRRFI